MTLSTLHLKIIFYIEKRFPKILVFEKIFPSKVKVWSTSPPHRVSEKTSKIAKILPRFFD
eukprot:UN16156